MLITKSITHFIQCEQLKLQNHFFEMITATISHDMRTPLNAILGLGKNLERYIDHENGRKFHKVMMNSASLLLFLVNDLLDLFRLNNNKFTRNESLCNLREHLTDLLSMFSIQAEEKGISLKLDVSN